MFKIFQLHFFFPSIATVQFLKGDFYKIQMVLIVYKKSDKNTFAIESSPQAKVSAILTTLIQINNLRVYLDRLIWSVQQLANKGVLKPPELQGVSWEDFQKHQSEFSSLPEQMRAYGRKPIIEAPYRYVADKHNQRYGVILPQQQRQLMLTSVTQAKKVFDFKGQVVKQQQLVQAVQSLRNAVMEAYPGYIDLPQWQPTLLMLQEKIQLQILETQAFEIFDEKATVWWAGKALEKDKNISQYVGKNDKTKVIVKVQKWGGQQPLREPPVDAETYQKMVKYYYKKSEESKQFEKKSVEAHYQKLQTRDLKAQLHLQQEVRFKPF